MVWIMIVLVLCVFVVIFFIVLKCGNGRFDCYCVLNVV